MLTRWQPNCAPMLDSLRYCRGWCGLSVHPPAWLSEYWCVSEQGKAVFDCIVDLVLVSVLSPLTPKGSLSWFCVQSLSWFQWQRDISQGPLNTLALSRLSPVFNFLFVIDVSLHIHPGLINLPWYSPCSNAHLEGLSVFPPSWSSATSVHGSALLRAAGVTSWDQWWAQGFLKSHQTFEEILHILVVFRWYQPEGLVVSSIPQTAGSPWLCYGKAVCCFFCTNTCHGYFMHEVATSLPSVISLSDSTGQT